VASKCHLLDTLFTELLTAANGLHRILGAALYLGDDLVDLRRRVRRAFSQGANLVRHHGETTTLLTGPRRLNRRIQGQQIGLLGDGADHFQHGTDAAAVFIQSLDDIRGIVNFLPHLGDATYGVLHHLLTFVGGPIGLIRRLSGGRGIFSHVLCRRRHLVHRGGYHIGAGELLPGALGHQPGDFFEFMAGTV